MTKKRIGSISIRQTSALVATIFFILSFVLCSLVFLGIAEFVGADPDRVPVVGSFGILTVVTVDRWGLYLHPFLSAVCGYLISAVACWIYNMAARHTGGIEIELKDTEEKS